MLKDNLKALRESKGLTKKQVAQGVGINERAYIAYEYGERDVSTETLCKFADFYGVSTDYLLGREKPMPPDLMTRLAQEFHLTELDKLLVQTYIAISPSKRTKFVEAIAKIVEQKESKQQEESQRPDIQISQSPARVIARSKSNPFCEAPTPEQIASFTPVPEDSDL
ncbi:MAG: helix-turn-helix transcriptional regulator [Ruminococcus sp.]|nr:helix-turn-helix transcriptional regulator [Ruminococcus sp.]